MQTKSKSFRKGKFTIIKFLGVVVIILIMAALLLPALNSARAKASRARCVSNQKQIATALFLYTDDYDSYYPLSFNYKDTWRSVWQKLYEVQWGGLGYIQTPLRTGCSGFMQNKRSTADRLVCGLCLQRPHGIYPGVMKPGAPA